MIIEDYEKEPIAGANFMSSNISNFFLIMK